MLRVICFVAVVGLASASRSELDQLNQKMASGKFTGFAAEPEPKLMGYGGKTQDVHYCEFDCDVHVEDWANYDSAYCYVAPNVTVINRVTQIQLIDALIGYANFSHDASYQVAANRGNGYWSLDDLFYRNSEVTQYDFDTLVALITAEYPTFLLDLNCPFENSHSCVQFGLGVSGNRESILDSFPATSWQRCRHACANNFQCGFWSLDQSEVQTHGHYDFATGSGSASSTTGGGTCNLYISLGGSVCEATISSTADPNNLPSITGAKNCYTQDSCNGEPMNIRRLVQNGAIPFEGCMSFDETLRGGDHIGVCKDLWKIDFGCYCGELSGFKKELGEEAPHKKRLHPYGFDLQAVCDPLGNDQMWTFLVSNDHLFSEPMSSDELAENYRSKCSRPYSH